MVRVNTTDELMIVHVFRKGICPGPFSESLIRSRLKTSAEIRRRAVAHIAAEGEVNEKRASVVLARPRMPSRVQPMRVNEVMTGKRSQGSPRLGGARGRIGSEAQFCGGVERPDHCAQHSRQVEDAGED